MYAPPSIFWSFQNSPQSLIRWLYFEHSKLTLPGHSWGGPSSDLTGPSVAVYSVKVGTHL